MTTIDKTDARLSMHEEICALRPAPCDMSRSMRGSSDNTAPNLGWRNVKG